MRMPPVSGSPPREQKVKRGELIILWVGGLLSVALLVLVRVPTSIRDEVLRGGPSSMATVAAYVFEVIARLLAIWIICGLVWLTLYRRL
jgi:hypothetical protein